MHSKYSPRSIVVVGNVIIVLSEVSSEKSKVISWVTSSVICIVKVVGAGVVVTSVVLPGAVADSVADSVVVVVVATGIYEFQRKT